MTQATCATTEGTRHYLNRFSNAAPNHFRNQQTVTLSSIGVGTYLGKPDDATDAKYIQSIVRAGQLGSNVIDSAANYRFQRSERAIGTALTELSKLGFTREELVVCTKGGYIPFDGAPPRNVREYIEETFVRTGIASFDDFVGGSHCMTPAYLQNQLDQSLRNMKLNCVDVYYVHNPESQLGHVSESEFHYRIDAAFERLEENRAEGKLNAYGVATWNGFRAKEGSSGYHSLSRMVDEAKRVGGENHGFRFIQLPFNLGMPEALTLVNQRIGDEQLTLLEAAQALGVTVVSSASILQGQVAHSLPEAVRDAMGSLPTDAQTAIQFVRSTPGITTALIGMSSVEHVDENLELIRVEPAGASDFAKLFS